MLIEKLLKILWNIQKNKKLSISLLLKVIFLKFLNKKL